MEKLGIFEMIDTIENSIGSIDLNKTSDVELFGNIDTWACVIAIMLDKLTDIANSDTADWGLKTKAENYVESISDGYHTFGELYNQRLNLFAALVNSYPNISWKSKKHSDGKECFNGDWFIVGINTPNGQYTYHYKNEYWNMFRCKELETAPEWDGHTAKDVGRVLSLNNKYLP